MKRVKKGVRISLPGGHRRVECIAKEVNGLLMVEPVTDNSHGWSFSAAQCEALGMTAVLEDVPEPWERVRDALDAVFGIGRPRAYPCSEEQCRRIADALGIKPEGES